MSDYEPDFFVNIGGTLIARYPQACGFKRSGTSERAAKEVQHGAPTLRDSVLSVLRQKPSTADECASALSKSVLAIRPRLSELSKLALICETADRRRNASGKLASVWRAI